jgi:hypothetical protein
MKRLAAALIAILGAHCVPGVEPAQGSDAGGGGMDGGGGGGGDLSHGAPDLGPPVDAGDPGPSDVTFTISSNQNAHAIPSLVYGVNDGNFAAATHATIVRSGGNRLTAFNWENNASNAGSDYQFENDDSLCGGITCAGGNNAPGGYLKAIIDQASAAGAATLLTIPIVDYVAADKSPAGDVRNSGSNYLSTRFKQNKAAKGSAFADPPDATDGFVYEDELVSWLGKHEPTAHLVFLLDNEPDLWSSTHAEVHPVAVTYAELKQRSIEYATAIKAVMPSALVWGPVSYGWGGYVNLQGASDAAANGDFVEYYLDQMKAGETAAGHRLVDGLDLHWYPEATGGGQRIVGGDNSAPVAAAREQAPRSLWDTTYTETSWITQDSTMGPINLIPRMLDKITKHYPGTMLSFSEWNYGGGNDISGAIASADVLGIFGRDGVSMATMWPGGDESFTYAAFKIYRNYDGAGKAFGDTSISATTSDVPNSSVYASLDSSNTSRVVLVVINKALAAKVAGIRVNHPTVFSKANVYTLTAGGGSNVVAGTAISSVAVNAFSYKMPAQSVSVLELIP